MSRVKWLLLIGLLWLSPARGATSPLIVQSCGQISLNANTALTYTCVLSNVTAGNTLIYATRYVGTLTVNTQTETFTCPAASQILSGSVTMQKCFVVLASSHASFTLTVTTNGSQMAGLILKEIQGLGAEDTGARGATASATSLNTTTANANEWVDVDCGASANDITPGSGFIQTLWTSATPTTNQENRIHSEHRIVAVASTTTSACTFVTNANNMLTVLAFQQSSPPTVPAVNVIQFCQNQMGANGSNATCELANTVAGHKIVFGVVGIANSAITTFACASTETCTCPTNATIQVAYAHQYIVSVCYSDTASSHATFSAGVSAAGPASFNPYIYFAMEVSGLPTGDDTGSEASCTAVTCNYTTAQNNEWTFFIGAGHPNGTQQLPGNSFIQLGYGTTTLNNGANESSQFIAAYKLTATAGSNTASYTQASNTAPLLSVVAFGPSTSTQVRKKSVIM